jgi:peptidoglycan/LPS O-acetylase OafA/YrhL
MGILRLLLAFCVLEGHLDEETPGPGFFGLGLLNGNLAVEMFFVISGFYMALVLHGKYNRPGNYLTFIQQRFLRLYPTYLFILLFFVVIYGLIYLTTSHVFGSFFYWRQYCSIQNPFTFCLFGGLNLTVLGQDFLSFFRQDTVTGQLYFCLPPPGSVTVWTPAFLLNRPSWTLSVEFSFYLLAPLLVRRSVVIQIAVLLASLALRTWFYEAEIWPVHAWTYFFFPSTLLFFMAGSLGYRVYRSHRDTLRRFGQTYWWIFLGFMAVIVLYRRLPAFYQSDLIFIALAAAVVPLLFATTEKNKMDRFIGELSYPFYLIHWNSMILIGIFMGRRDSFSYEPACILVTLLLSWLCYRFFEAKIESYRERIYRRSIKKTSRNATGTIS